MRRSLLAVISAAAALSVAVASCKRDSRESAPPPPAELVPDASVRGDSGVASAPLWAAALATPEDAIELARLAEAEGATGLQVGLEEGGAVGLVALAALPFADDAELAMGRLSEIVLQTDATGIPPVIDAMEGITLRPLTQTEPRNPVGVHACFDALLVLSKRTELTPQVRARAVSVARLIASRGPYDAKLLPTEFDK